jgi:hypothetical protein
MHAETTASGPTLFDGQLIGMHFTHVPQRE